MNHADQQLLADIRAKLKTCTPVVRHDVRNLLMAYEAMWDLVDISDTARRRLPALENELRHFLETGKPLKHEPPRR